MKTYNKQERKLILKHNLSPQELSKRLGRSASAISTARQRLRKKLGIQEIGQLNRGRFRFYWSKDDDHYLRDKYGIQDTYITARELKRTVQSVTHRASQLGIRRHGDGYFTASRFAKVFGVCHQTVRNWILKGLLRATKGAKKAGPHQVWVISPTELPRFANSHKGAYDPARVKYEFLQSKDTYISTREAAQYLRCSTSALTKLARGNKVRAYKGFGPAGHQRWYFDLSSLDSLRYGRCITCGGKTTNKRRFCSHSCSLSDRRRRYRESKVKVCG